MLKEYRDVPITLESKGKIDHIQFKALVSGIAAFVSNAKVVRPHKILSFCRDEKDNMILESCLAAEADFLITGDNDLLSIGDLPFKLEVLTPKEFLKR